MSGGREKVVLKADAVNHLVTKLLADIRISRSSLGKRAASQLSDLKGVLTADYRQAPGMPPEALLRDLARLVDKDIRSQSAAWKHWGNPERFASLSRLVGPPDLAVQANPYRTGAGLSLRGFFCRAEVGDERKFVFFLNTAHHPGAVAATFGHELGHYIYGSKVGETDSMVSFFEGTFTKHLLDEEELFADSLVALAAYDRELIARIGSLRALTTAGTSRVLERMKLAFKLIGSLYGLDLRAGKLAAGLRIGYLTSLTHFLKLRSALWETTGL